MLWREAWKSFLPKDLNNHPVGGQPERQPENCEPGSNRFLPEHESKYDPGVSAGHEPYFPSLSEDGQLSGLLSGLVVPLNLKR